MTGIGEVYHPGGKLAVRGEGVAKRLEDREPNPDLQGWLQPVDRFFGQQLHAIVAGDELHHSYFERMQRDRPELYSGFQRAFQTLKDKVDARLPNRDGMHVVTWTEFSLMITPTIAGHINDVYHAQQAGLFTEDELIAAVTHPDTFLDRMKNINITPGMSEAEVTYVMKRRAYLEKMKYFRLYRYSARHNVIYCATARGDMGMQKR